jgi:hypothetical protein
VFLGFDAAEMRACNVAETSLYAHSSRSAVTVTRVSRSRLGSLYTRPTSRMPNGQLFDDISGAPMSTGHAIARFFVPLLCDFEGWALFTDGDVLFREDVRQVFALADERYAIQVVQHPPLLEEGDKKAGHVQQAYHRKNWSSVMLIQCGHPANRALTVDVLNAWPGRDLHAFRWLSNDLIGALPARWNYLNGVSAPQDDPALVHFTLGCPDVPGHEHDAFSDEWYGMARGAQYRLMRPPAPQAEPC